MNQLIFPPKNVGETIPLIVSFADRLQPGEGINGAVVTASVYSGTDNNPSALISGTATYDAFGNATQVITGGVAGVVYTLVYLITGTNSHNYIKVGQLAILSSSPY